MFLSCLVVRVDESICKGSAAIEISQQSRGYLSSLVTEETGCGSFDKPWWITVASGQRIKITLLDFGQSLFKEQECQCVGSTCYVYAVFKEGHMKNSQTVCAATTEPRQRIVYSSTTSTVEVRIVSNRKMLGKSATHFLLQFEGEGRAWLLFSD